MNSKFLRENVNDLPINVAMLEIDVSCYYPFSYVVAVHLNVFSLSMKHRISCKLDAIEVIAIDGYRFVDRFIHILS